MYANTVRMAEIAVMQLQQAQLETLTQLSSEVPPMADGHWEETLPVSCACFSACGVWVSCVMYCTWIAITLYIVQCDMMLVCHTCVSC